MTALTSLGLFIFAVMVFAIRELQLQGKLKWMPDSVMSFGHASFWGSESWKRKYKYNNGTPVIAPNNWYYRFFKIKYKESFSLSATLLVSLTDAPHALQLAFKLLIIGSLVSYKEMVNPLVDGLIYFGIFGLVFTVVYKEFSK